MKNNELIDWYVRGANKGKASNLKIEGDKLINYETVIAYRMGSRLFMINGEHYSPTTSRIQNYLKKQLDASPNVYFIFDNEEDFNMNVSNHMNCVNELEDVE